MSFESVIAEATKSLLVPSHSVPTHTALPTVIPDKPEWQYATKNVGGVVLWVVFAVMLIATIAFTALAYRVPVTKRLFHTITILITLIATLSYFAMALKQGKTWHKIVEVDHHKHGIPPVSHVVYREVYFARYVDWLLTTPLLLLDLSLLAGLNGSNVLVAIVADLIMILGGMFAAFGHGGAQKWGWYAIACIAYIVIIWQLFFHGRATAFARNSKVGNFFVAIAAYSIIVWTAYPIIWGVADGSRHLSVDGEIIAYAVLDILAKGVFGTWLLLTHARMPESNVELGGFWANGLTGEGAIRLGEDGA